MFDENDSLGLAGVLEALRAEIATAQENAHEAKINFPITGVTVEMKVAVTRHVDGKAGFRVPLTVDLSAKGGWRSESLQTVTVNLDAPVAASGLPVRVNSSANAEKG
ncbi:trypco2 family protein [Actinoplanes sp. NPDC020271]|uniref:trypco2 family protein n=1 Tax=Actinoplanes sp. NPDC020271 TaxID=3363896 RepID=UPI00379C9927